MTDAAEMSTHIGLYQFLSEQNVNIIITHRKCYLGKELQSIAQGSTNKYNTIFDKEKTHFLVNKMKQEREFTHILKKKTAIEALRNITTFVEVQVQSGWKYE